MVYTAANSKPKGVVLVVDDEDRIRNIVCSNIIHGGFDVVEAHDGLTALSVAEAILPDVILLDLMMPGIDGYEVCSRLKASEATADIPVIMLTAKTHVDDKVKGLDIGANDYLSKPFQIAELVSRVNAAFRIKKLQDELKEANRIKDKFLAIAGHDLRSPLSAINLWGNFLAEDCEKSNEDVISAGQAINRISKQMLCLINDLLDTAKLNLGVMRVDLEPVDVEKLGTDIVSFYRPIMDSEGIEFHSEIAGDLPNIFADPNRILEVMQNLLSNALKFTGRGGKINLRVGRMSVDRLPKSESNRAVGDEMKQVDLEKFILFDVEDTGNGIEESELNRIFDKYVQMEKRSDRRSTGLGLAICKEIVLLHGGYIWAESEVGRGSVFSFIIPTSDNSSGAN